MAFRAREKHIRWGPPEFKLGIHKLKASAQVHRDSTRGHISGKSLFWSRVTFLESGYLGPPAFKAGHVSIVQRSPPIGQLTSRTKQRDILTLLCVCREIINP